MRGRAKLPRVRALIFEGTYEPENPVSPLNRELSYDVVDSAIDLSRLAFRPYEGSRARGGSLREFGALRARRT